MQARINMRNGDVQVKLMQVEANVLQQALNLLKGIAQVGGNIWKPAPNDVKAAADTIEKLLELYGPTAGDTSGSGEPEVPVVEKLSPEEEEAMVKEWGKKKKAEQPTLLKETAE